MLHEYQCISSRSTLRQRNTAFTKSTQQTLGLINIVEGAPLVVKLLGSTQGRGVVLAETKKAAESVIGAFRGLKAEFLVQEFIKEAAGTDIRCFVIGGKVVASIMRRAEEGEFRSNLHRGGEALAIKITKAERLIAVKAANAIGLNVAGVDPLRSDKGPMVLEINSSPGIQGVERATGINVANNIIDHIEKNVRPRYKNKRAKKKSA